MDIRSHSSTATCALCGEPLVGGQTLPASGGGLVHVTCAEYAAHAAARGRAIRAVASALLLLGIGGWWVAAESWRLSAEGWEIWVVLAVLLIVVHVLINQRWWHYTVQSARRWLGIRG